MKDIKIDLKPARDLAQAEHEAASNLTQAEGEDTERKAAVEAGTRQPPGPKERPYLNIGRGRAPTHEANSAAITSQVTVVISRQSAADTADDALDTMDEEADALELRFWNQWGALDNPDSLGRKLFYPNATRSDYGNPSHDRNRDWWDRAGANFRNAELVFPPEFGSFRDAILSISDRYGTTLDSYRAAAQSKFESWKELSELGRQARKIRRITRSRLKDDFDGVMKWVDALVAPPSKGKPNPPREGSS